MATEQEIKEAYKMNLIELVKHHRNTCDETCGENCNVSLALIWKMMQDAGYTFTKEERGLFI